MNPVKTTTHTRIRELQQQVALLRSFIIGAVGRDSEGEYRPEFVERIFQAMQEPATHTFRDAGSFLTQLKRHTA